MLLFGVTISNGELINKMNDGRKQQIRSFLNNISQIESSGGKNFNHSVVKTGIHAEHKAIGRYGLMPNTIAETLNRMRISGTLTPELKELNKLDTQTLKSTLENNPELEDQIAEALASRVLDRQKDEEMAAYSWNQGHNLSPNDITQASYKDHDYVKKYNTYKKLSTGEE
jgi:hypothetical protein